LTTEELFERHRMVALDSNVLIYLLEGSGTLADASAALIDGIESGAASGVLASVALTEVLTRPASLGEALLFERQADELRSIANLRIVPLDTEIAIDAAWGRSGERDLGDAIHIATARRSGATCFITNDARVRGQAGVDVVRLADIEIVEPSADAGQGDGAEPADDSERSPDAYSPAD
jgi:predicted nucleic acid-binding protein